MTFYINVLMDGFSVLVDQAWTIFSILIIVVWGQTIFTAIFKKAFEDQFTFLELFSLSLAGWILPSSLLSVLLFIGVFLFGEIAAIVIFAIATGVFISTLFVWKLNRVSLLTGLILILSFAFFLTLKLAFLRNIILPSYFDSAEHYRIIKYFVGYYELPSNDLPLSNYYHVGFHLLSASISYFFDLEIVDTILVFGQAMLAILPFSLFFIVKRETGSNAAAAFTGLLAGLGWHMPSHLMNWGKYPALFSLVGIHFVLNVGYLAYRSNRFKFKRSIYWLLGLGVLVSALIHTRSLIVFVCMIIAILFTAWRGRLPLFFQWLVFVLVLCALAVQIFVVQKSSILTLLFGYYTGQDIFATSLVIFFLIFSSWAFPDLTFFMLAISALMMTGLFIPVTGFAGYGPQTLLDRPYVQMILYLPLSILGGLGLSGLFQFLQGLSFYPKRLMPFVTLFFVVFLFWNAKNNHKFYPSDCCQFFNRDDLAALQWMDRTLPLDSNIMIAASNLYVTSLEEGALAGADSGIWIAPMISRKTIPVRGNLSFDRSDVHVDICRQKIDFIYVGNMPQSFNVLQLDAQKDWYQIAFLLPQARVYQVIACP